MHSRSGRSRHRNQRNQVAPSRQNARSRLRCEWPVRDFGERSYFPYTVRKVVGFNLLFWNDPFFFFNPERRLVVNIANRERGSTFDLFYIIFSSSRHSLSRSYCSINGFIISNCSFLSRRSFFGLFGTPGNGPLLISRLRLDSFPICAFVVCLFGKHTETAALTPDDTIASTRR